MTPNIYPQFSVSNFERSLTFYDSVLAELGFPRCNNMEVNGTREAEYCFDEFSKILSLVETPSYSETTTRLLTKSATFPAKNQAAVDAFYATAIKNRAVNESQPCLRDDQSYAGFVLDPDGHRIGAACRHP